MKTSILTTLTIFFLVLTGLAHQGRVQKACPAMKLIAPITAKAGTLVVLKARVAGADKITYNWAISSGTITKGQGTSEITIDTAKLGGTSVTATVEVSGFDPACPNTKSVTFDVLK